MRRGLRDVDELTFWSPCPVVTTEYVFDLKWPKVHLEGV